MGFWDIFKGSGSKAVSGADAKVERDLAKLMGASAGGNLAPGKSPRELIEAYRELPALRAIVQRIAESLAFVQWSVYRVANTKDGKSLYHRALSNAPMKQKGSIAKRLKAARMVEVTNDPIIQFLDMGNPFMNGFEARQVMFSHFETVGEMVTVIERSASGMPIGYWPINPAAIRELPSRESPYYEVDINGTTVKHPKEDVLFIKDPDPSNPYGRGTGLGMALGDEIETDEYIAGYLKTFFLNDTTPTAILAFEDASEDEIERLQRRWDDYHRGSDRGNRTYFMNQVPNVTTYESNFRDLQMVELRSFLRNIIRETWGMPPEIMGMIENSNRATIDAAGYIFAQWILVPRLERFRIALQTQLVPMFDKRKILTYESPVPEDSDFQLAVATAAPWSRTKNEWRVLQDLEPRDDGDVYVAPFGMEETPAGSLVDSEGKRKSVSKAPVAKAPGQLTTAEINAIVATLDPSIPQDRLDWFEQVLIEGGEAELENLGSDAAFQPNDDLRKHLDDFFDARIPEIWRFTGEVLDKVIRDSIQAGAPVDSIMDTVSNVFDASADFRATRIARTEVVRSTNLAILEARKQEGVSKQEWVTQMDGKVRPQHADIDGQTVGVNATFTLPDGTPTIAPGNSGVAAQDVNCRCTTAPVFEDESRQARPNTAEFRTAVWKRFDKQTRDFEKRAEKDFARSFEEQKEITLAKITELTGVKG